MSFTRKGATASGRSPQTWLQLPPHPDQLCGTRFISRAPTSSSVKLSCCTKSLGGKARPGTLELLRDSDLRLSSDQLKASGCLKMEFTKEKKRYIGLEPPKGMSRNTGQEVEGEGPCLGPSPQSWESSSQRRGAGGAQDTHTHTDTHANTCCLLGSLRTRQPLWTYPRLGHAATSCHQNRGLTNLELRQRSRGKRTGHILPKEAPLPCKVWNS